MAELKIYLSDSLNEKFRRMAMSVYGYGRGSLSKAAEEALTKWCSEHEPSSVPERTTEHTENTQGNTSGAAESHINPDERENVDQEAKRLGRHSSLSPIGAST